MKEQETTTRTTTTKKKQTITSTTSITTWSSNQQPTTTIPPAKRRKIKETREKKIHLYGKQRTERRKKEADKPVLRVLLTMTMSVHARLYSAGFVKIMPTTSPPCTTPNLLSCRAFQMCMFFLFFFFFFFLLLITLFLPLFILLLLLPLFVLFRYRHIPNSILVGSHR